MRMLFLNHNVAWRGGTFFRAYSLAVCLVRRGHSVTLLTISPRRRWGFAHESREGVEIVETPDLLWGVGRTGIDPWDTLSRFWYLRNRCWDIVHAWDCRPAVILPALFARRQSRAIGGRLVIDWCDWWGRGGTQAERPGLTKLFYGPVETFFEEAFRRHADGTTVISRALADRALRLMVPGETPLLLPQGCDVDGSEAGDRPEARRRLGLPEYCPVVVSVGALTNSEATLLFDSSRLLWQRRPDCRVVMIGNHRVQIPTDLKAAPQFLETGYVSDVKLKDYISACDALLVPLADSIASRARWPSKANPFLAAGRVVVMSRVGDLADLLEREGAGVVSRCEPDGVVEGLIRVLHDHELKARLERRAREVAGRVLAWPIIAAQLEDLYTRLGNLEPSATGSGRAPVLSAKRG